MALFAELCHDSENITPPEATTANVVRLVVWIGERGHIGAKSLQPYLSAINTISDLHNIDPIAMDSLHPTAARRGLMLRQRSLEAAPMRVTLHVDVVYSFVERAELANRRCLSPQIPVRLPRPHGLGHQLRVFRPGA